MRNKRLIITLIVFLALLAITLIILMIILLNGGFKNFNFLMFSSVSDNLVFEEKYQESFRMIEISSDASEIEIIETEEDIVRLTVYGEEKNIDVTKKGERLSVTSKMNCHFFCFNQKRSKIVISVPKHYSGKIKVDNDFGNVVIGEFINADIIVEENCGDIEVSSGNNVKLDNDYGDIKLEYASQAEIKQSAGNIIVGEVKDINAKNNLGDITIEKVTNSLELESDCGDIVIDDIILNENSSIENDLGKVKIGFTNEIYIDATTDLGKVKINENTKKSDITLKIENSCGDIIINN